MAANEWKVGDVLGFIGRKKPVEFKITDKRTEGKVTEWQLNGLRWWREKPLRAFVDGLPKKAEDWKARAPKRNDKDS